MRVFVTDYAQAAAPWGYQCPPGKITRGVETDGRGYQRHECEPGVNWQDGMQRADAIDDAHALTPYCVDGQEVAFAWPQLLEPGFYAPNPGWCAVGPEIHDVHGGTQSPITLLASEDGVTVRAFGGAIAANGAPVDPADKFYSATFPVTLGAYHALVLGVVFSPDRTKGRVRLGIDGATVLDQTCATIYTGSTGYLKQAFYRDPNPPKPNRLAAVRFGNMDAYAGAGAWAEALAVAPAPAPPPLPPPTPIHDAVTAARAAAAKVSATSNPNIRAALDRLVAAVALLSDDAEPR